eukprot:TRINITY_DN31271_c0_g1_i2.p2 TRINITY_DN31271_c0_g1~~TRINITY_DN31271_c0_g1_i2.p2  ORF type:complete len:126 (+),score=11.80 TRINITY_DN31271_c0_g1_i2:298-675(+)
MMQARCRSAVISASVRLSSCCRAEDSAGRPASPAAKGRDRPADPGVKGSASPPPALATPAAPPRAPLGDAGALAACKLICGHSVVVGGTPAGDRTCSGAAGAVGSGDDASPPALSRSACKVLRTR